MRVAVLHFTAPPISGGVEKVMLEHIRLLRTAGHEVTVIAGRGGPIGVEGVDLHLIPEMAATFPAQVEVERELARGRVTGRFQELDEALFNALEPCLRDQDAVLAHNALTLHFNLPLASVLARLGREALRDRLVAWTHDIAAVNPLYQADVHAGHPWSLVSHPQAGVRYVCVSAARRTQLIRLWESENVADPPSPTVIPNGIDVYETLNLPASIRALADRGRLPDRDIVCLLPVRITRRKNIELAVDVVAALAAAGHDAILVVTGPTAPHHPERSAEYLRSLRDRAVRSGVSERVLFAAQEAGRELTASEVASLYSLADLLFLPSRSEGFGLPVLEAAVARLPMVVADLPVLRELAGGGARYFSENPSLDEICEMVVEAAGAGGNAMRKSTIRRFSWPHVWSDQFEPFLDSIRSPHVAGAR